MTFEQTRTYIKGVLKKWFTNKTTLDKLTESSEGNLLFNGSPITTTETIKDSAMTTAIEEDINELNELNGKTTKSTSDENTTSGT